MKKLLILPFCLVATSLSAVFPSFSISNERRARAAALLADSPQAFKAALEGALESTLKATQYAVEDGVICALMGGRLAFAGPAGIALAACLPLPGVIDACISAARA